MEATEQFRDLIATVTREIEGLPLDDSLQTRLNERFPPDGERSRQIFESCRQAIADGWMCDREAGGIRYGRVIRPSPETHGFSVDVVDMDSVVGPRHRHPNGEIDLVMPLTPDARFDGQHEGWKVYGPDSVHAPTVSNGRALVLYLLPDGAIDFKPAADAGKS